MLTPQEVSTHAFTKAMMGGYNMAMVDEFLDELTEDYTSLYKENAALKAKMKVLVEKVEEYRATEDSMRATLLTAQRMADSIIHEAEDKRGVLLSQTESDIEARKKELQKELTVLETRLREGQMELKRFIKGSEEICKKQLAFLEKLPSLPVDLPADNPLPAPAPAAEEPVPPQPAAAAQPSPTAAVSADPIPEASLEAEVESAVEELLSGGESVEEPTRRINLEDLKFGRNYSGGT